MDLSQVFFYTMLVILQELDFLFKPTSTKCELCTIFWFNSIQFFFFLCSFKDFGFHWISRGSCPNDGNHKSRGWFKVPRCRRLSFGNWGRLWLQPWVIYSHLRWKPMPSTGIWNMATICHFRSKVYLLGLLYTVPIAKMISLKNARA